MSEAPFTEFSSRATFYVVSSVGGPRTGSTTGFSDWLHRVRQVLRCMHVQRGFDASMYTTCIWFLTSVAASVLVSRDHKDQDWAPDDQLRSVLAAMSRQRCMAGWLTVSCGDLRRLTGNGSALEVVLHDDALYKSTFTLPVKTKQMEVVSAFMMYLILTILSRNCKHNELLQSQRRSRHHWVALNVRAPCTSRTTSPVLHLVQPTPQQPTLTSFCHVN